VSGYDAMLTVVTFAGAGGLGASATAAAAAGAPTVSLTATGAGSLAYATGTDFDTATPRTVGANQSLVSQWVDAGSGNTFWTQGTTGLTTGSGQTVTLNDTAPISDQWDMAAVEVVPSAHTASTPPTVSIINPTNAETISATVPVAGHASDDVGLASTQFYLDGQPLGNPVTSAPYALNFDTTKVSNGGHVLSVRAIDTGGRIGTSPGVRVTVQNPAPPMTCFVMETNVTVHGRGAVTTPALHTAAANEVLVAFVSADGPAGPDRQRVSISGAGLRWKLVKRQNAQSGDAEVWTATAATVSAGVTVKSTETMPGYDQDLTVIGMEGVAGIGGSAAASGARGAPTVDLTTTRATSLVFAVGNERGPLGNAGTIPTGWALLNRWFDTQTGDFDVSQYTNDPTGPAGSVVRVSDTGPNEDVWNLVAVELLNNDA
jgi:hypothetical protein